MRLCAVATYFTAELAFAIANQPVAIITKTTHPPMLYMYSFGSSCTRRCVSPSVLSRGGPRRRGTRLRCFALATPATPRALLLLHGQRLRSKLLLQLLMQARRLGRHLQRLLVHFVVWLLPRAPRRRLSTSAPGVQRCAVWRRTSLTAFSKQAFALLKYCIAFSRSTNRNPCAAQPRSCSSRRALLACASGGLAVRRGWRGDGGGTSTRL